MRTYIIRRLIYAIPTLVGISVIVFLITRLSPGDPIRLFTFGATDLTREDIEALRHVYGLDRPMHEQFISYIVKMAVFAPRQTASVSIAVAAYPRSFHSTLKPKRTSRIISTSDL